MSGLPDTTRSKPRRRIEFPWFAALAAALLLGAVAVAVFSGGSEIPEPGEEVYAGVEDIAAGTRDVAFPRSDASRFGGGTSAVRVYLRVEDVPVAGRMSATVERTGRSSAFSALFGGADVRAEDGGEGRLSVSEDGASGVVSFVVRAADGGALPAGGYGVEVRFGSGGDGGAGRVAARKYFEIGDPQD
ncbi:MAG: hypothetical protein AVDCRST_MAG03-96 [uncultured Rubrobacteraceae bacterium]|uniref:Uncharacterized protein n=1 Tax=uncultured Rubrobacteraceae bacterium TaxID=349277 RepID=A0A6J4NHV2_9ACTN|nr:MAG: hypothetical protein AVDCRST_MAG03-96 [uncultured Rubrobacteraceae bacterium]